MYVPEFIVISLKLDHLDCLELFCSFIPTKKLFCCYDDLKSCFFKFLHWIFIFSEKPFVVVQFRDLTYSELPTIWLTPEKSHCYWPPKPINTFSLMSKGKKPDVALWDKYEVIIVGYYDTLMKARRKAESNECSTTEDESLGRGKRVKNKFRIFARNEEADVDENNTTSEEEDTSVRLSPPPKFPTNKSSVTSINHGNEKSQTVTFSQSNTNNIATFIQPSNLNDIQPYILNPDNTLTAEEINNAEIYIQETQPNTPASSYTDISLPSTSGRGRQDSVLLDRLLDMCIETNRTVRSINERLKNIEGVVAVSPGISRSKSDDELKTLLDQLPLKTLEELENFEKALGSGETKHKFLSYLHTVGGHHAKDNVNRLLKKIFSNELGTKCSWLGQRNNYRICDLNVIRVIRDVIVNSFTGVKEKDFENFVSEWFRLSKLRLQREKK